MARWAIFFFAMFLISSFFASSMGSGGAIGSTPLANVVSATDTTLPVADTSDFTSSGYVVMEDEIVTYTAKNATNFLNVTRGVIDPETGLATTAAAHMTGAYVNTLVVSTSNQFVDMTIVQSNATFGTFNAVTFGSRFFKDLPKEVAWNYPFLDNQGGALLKYFIFYPLSVGFILSVFYSMLSLAMGIFKL